MKRLFKIVFGLLGALVLLLVLAAVALPLIYDKEDLKKAIAGEVYEQTGRELSINGALDFSVFPWLAVEVSDLSLSNADGFGDQPFARIGQARAGVALMPLLRKQISVDEITLDGLELALAVNDKGRNNWDDLSAVEEPAAAEDSGRGMFSSKRVAGLNLRRANVEYHDRQTGAHYRLNDFSMQTGALGEGEPVPVELKAMLEDIGAGTRAEVELEATAAIDLDAEKYVFDDFDLEAKLETAQGSPMVRIRAPKLDLDLAAQTLLLESFNMELDDLEATGALSARRILDDPAYTGSLAVAEFSPLSLMRALQMDVPVTADPAVLQKAGFSAEFSGSSTQFTLSGFSMELDQSHFSGELSVQNFDRPNIAFDLTVDEIDLDRYLEPASKEADAEDVAMPQEELKGQDVQGQLRVESLRLAGLEFNAAEVGVSIRNGKLRLHPLTAGFYGGRYSGDVALDGSGAVPVLSLDEKIDAITFQRLVAALVDSESLSGMALGHVRLTGRGKSSSEVLGNLQGDLGLTLTEGALEGINIWYEIRRGMALYKGLPAPDPEPKRTVFSRMQFSGSVQDGVVSTRELVGELPFLTLQGKGAIDLGRSQVDMSLVAQVRNAPELSDDPLASELKGKSLPFKIVGGLDAPKLTVDWAGLLKSEATGILLDKLGLGSKEETAEDTPGSEPEDDSSSQDQLKETAKGALFELLRGKEKEKDSDKEEDDGST